MSTITPRKPRQVIDWIALWVLNFGVWPLANPGHHADSLLSVVDIILHIVAAGVLLSRWRVVRRVQ